MADKIFLDTDVALDHLADRQPFAEYAHRLLALAETGDLTVCVSPAHRNPRRRRLGKTLR